MIPVGLQTDAILKTLSGCFNAASFAFGRTSQADGQIANPDGLVTGGRTRRPGYRHVANRHGKLAVRAMTGIAVGVHASFTNGRSFTASNRAPATAHGNQP